MRLVLFALFLAALPLGAWADTPDELRQKHREAAQKYFDAYTEGMLLEGSIDQDGSKGEFIAYYLNNEFYVRHSFGSLQWTSYSGPQGKWVGSNCNLPYKIAAQDNPANSVLNILSEGEYLDDEYFQYFEFVSEEAGGFNFRFAPPGLPVVDVVLYNDPEDPSFLQIMQIDVPISPSDPEAYSYRGNYYYESDDQGRPVIVREVAKEFNQKGDTQSEKNFLVEQMSKITAAPEGMTFDFERDPVGDGRATIPTAVDIPVRASDLRFMIPMHFEGSDKTFYFLFDTGASASLFSDEAANAAGLLPDLVIDGHGHGTVEQFEVGLLNNAYLGEAGGPRAPLANLRATRIPGGSDAIQKMLEYYGAHGILGVAPLHQYVMTLDYDNKNLTVWPPDQFSEDASVDVPNVEVWLDVEDLIYFTAQIDDQKGEVILDTGLQLDLAILEETMAVRGKEFEKVDERTSTVIGGTKSFDYVLIPNFSIGPLGWSNRQASVTDDGHGTLSARGVLGFVGVTLLIGNKVTLDAFNERMYIVPSDMGQFQEQLEMLKESPPPVETTSASAETNAPKDAG